MVRVSENFLQQITTLAKDGYSTVDGNSTRIVNVADPTDNQDLATKSYVDSVTVGGSAGGDLYGTYPDPNVVAAHFNTDRLTFDEIDDGYVLTRNGGSITGIDPSGFGSSLSLTINGDIFSGAALSSLIQSLISNGVVTSSNVIESRRPPLYAEDFDEPNTNWAVAAFPPLSVYTEDGTVFARTFSDSSEEGLGWRTVVPVGATTLSLEFIYAAETAPTGDASVEMWIYGKHLNGGSWDDTSLGILSLPDGYTSLQTATLSVDLVDISLSGSSSMLDSIAVIEITRGGGVTDTLTDGLILLAIRVEWE